MAMQIKRREFLFTGSMLGAAALVPSSQKAIAKESEVRETEIVDEDKSIKTYDWIDPNLSSFAATSVYNFIETWLVFYPRYYEEFKSGSITENDFIHNISDKWANAFATTISCFLAYGGRLSITELIAHNDLENAEEIKRRNRILADFMTMSTHYVKGGADRYLTNSLQHLLREAYKKILKSNPLLYKYQPWAIDRSEVIKTMKEIRQEEKNRIQVTNEKPQELKPDRGRDVLDLSLITFSYASAFIDFVPLLSANTIPIHTANTATGITTANIVLSAFVARDLLKRLKNKSDAEGFNEQKVLSIAETYQRTSFWLMNAITQSSLDSGFNFKKQSDKDVKHSNVRGLYGITASIFFTFVKYKLESLFRTSRKGSIDKGSRRRDLLQSLRRHEDWYFDPNTRN